MAVPAAIPSDKRRPSAARSRALHPGPTNSCVLHPPKQIEPYTHITEILPALMNQPARHYPLRMVNEPSVYVSGEKMGQKVFPPGGGPPMPSSAPPIQQPGMPMNFTQQQAMVAQQNNSMEMLERRREQERARTRAQTTNTVRSMSFPKILSEEPL